MFRGSGNKAIRNKKKKVGCITKQLDVRLELKEGIKIQDLNLRLHYAAAAKLLQSCPTLCNPIDHQALPSVGFSRQEYWSGLPFAFPETPL